MKMMHKTKIDIKLITLVLCSIFLISSCEKDEEGINEYGVPPGIDLSVPCPGNGTWYTTNMNELIAKFTSAAPILYSNQFDAKVVIKDWLVEITPIRYENTGVCIEIYYQLACDYSPLLTNEVYKGYIDPNKIGDDSNGDPIYKGVLVNGWKLRYWDYTSPANLYLNVRTNPNADEWWKKSLYKY